MGSRRYPEQAVLRDGRPVRIRPFCRDDVDALYDFFQRLPGDIQRFAWDRIDQRALVESWAGNIDFDKAFPLLAFDGSRVVADATLHRREHGPLRLVGRIKWLLDPEYRGAGLGAMLVNMLMDTAQANGLRHLTCMLISDLERDAVQVLKELGFKEYRIESYGADPDGGTHDMTKLIYSF